MILSRNFEDINSAYDFSEGIITNICWDVNLTDLMLTVYYFFDSPLGLKDKDIRIRFKNCSAVIFNCTNMLASMKEYSIVTPNPEIDHIILQKVLEQAKLKNIDRVLLTIREDNIPSRKACEHNGGKLEKIQYIENNNVCFYWIDLSQNKK